MTFHRVLFVEDDRISSFDSCEFLRDYSFDVAEASSATEAFAVIDQHAPLTALVTDINLGGGADGFEVARHAREAYPRLPVVFVSGSAGDRHQSEGVEGSKFIGKPFHPHQIIMALNQAIASEAASLHAA